MSLNLKYWRARFLPKLKSLIYEIVFVKKSFLSSNHKKRQWSHRNEGKNCPTWTEAKIRSIKKVRLKGIGDFLNCDLTLSLILPRLIFYTIHLKINGHWIFRQINKFWIIWCNNTTSFSLYHSFTTWLRFNRWLIFPTSSSVYPSPIH